MDTDTKELFEKIKYRLLAKCSITVDGCWEWIGYRDRDGYGQIKVEGRAQQAHRVSYLIHGGDLAPGMEVDHLCNFRACVRPCHLEAVTRDINQERMRERNGKKK